MGLNLLLFFNSQTPHAVNANEAISKVVSDIGSHLSFFVKWYEGQSRDVEPMKQPLRKLFTLLWKETNVSSAVSQKIISWDDELLIEIASITL